MFVLLKVQSLQLSFRSAGVSLGGEGEPRPPSAPPPGYAPGYEHGYGHLQTITAILFSCHVKLQSAAGVLKAPHLVADGLPCLSCTSPYILQMFLPTRIHIPTGQAGM